MADSWNTIRVFISSTFRDMHAERDYLVKFVFPSLREKLEKHRIHLVDIDLRWGVTGEQADNDQILDLCLEQIDECRPFFLGLLGERYGWVPDGYPDEAVTKYGWIQQQIGKSITEMEILYGVLRNHEMKSRAFFFYRDKSFTDNVPASRKSDVLPEDEESAVKLQELKQAILDANLPNPPVVEYPCQYSGLKLNWRLARRWLDDTDQATLEDVAADGIIDNQEYNQLPPHLQGFVEQNSVVYLEGLGELGDRVEAEIWGAVQVEYDLSDTLSSGSLDNSDPLAEEADILERYMESRLRVYVGRQRDLHDLTKFANDDDEVACLVSGPPGSGKSALLAKFITTYRGKHPAAFVVPCFTGASPATSNLPGLLRYLCGLLRQRFGFGLAIPDDDKELPTLFRTYLTLIPDHQSFLLVIDALNQLDEAHQAHELHWLPEELPAHVKLVVSCATPVTADLAAETVLAQFGKRMVYSVEVHPLTTTERRQILQAVPSLSAKSLDETQVRLLLENSATENPLFLLVALEELRGFGSFEELNDRIRALPSSGDTLTALFVQVVERLEIDFGHSLVQRMLTLLSVARRGLSEGELQTLVEEFDPASNLFPLLRQLRSYLFRRGDLLNFYHASLDQAIRSHYLEDVDELADAHRVLANFFQAQELSSRQIEELPWHLCEASEWQLDEADEWQRLYDLLADMPFFVDCWESDPRDVKRYWARLEANSQFRMVDAYQPVLNEPLKYNGDWVHLRQMAILLDETGHREEALGLRKTLSSTSRAANYRHLLLDSLIDEGASLQVVGESEEAMKVYEEAEHIARDLRRQDALTATLGNQAQILTFWGDLDSAINLLKQQEGISRELGDKFGIAKSKIGQAQILFTRGNMSGAMTLYQQAEQIFRGLGEKEHLAVSLGGQTGILIVSGELDRAMKLNRMENQICRELGRKDMLAASLSNRGMILKDRGDFAGAITLYEQSEDICREIGDRPGLSRALCNQGLIYYLQGEFDRAMALFRQHEEICRELGNKNGLQATLNNQGAILMDRVELDAAMVLFKEVELICRELENHDDLVKALCNQATILMFRNDLKGSMGLHKQAEQICRAFGHKDSLAQLLVNQALVLCEMRRFEEAVALANESSTIISNHGLTALAERLEAAIEKIRGTEANQ